MIFVGIRASSYINKSLQNVFGVNELVNRHVKGKHLRLHLLIDAASPLEIYIHNILYLISISLQGKHHKWETTQREGKTNSNCHDLFCFIKSLHTIKQAYPSWDTAALNSCFFQVVDSLRALFPFV